MKEKLKTVIDNFQKLKVLIIGDAILDTYVKGTTERICREAPVPVFTVQSKEHQCGGAANTAINVATLGAEVFFLTVLGKDANARELLDLLKKNKVHTAHILQDKHRVTIAKKRMTASSNIVLRVDEGTTDTISQACEKELLKKFIELYPVVDAIILSDYGYGVLTHSFIESIKDFATANHIPIVVDAKDLTRFKVLKPTAVKPNYEEALQLLNIKKAVNGSRVQQMIAFHKKILELTGAHKVALTLDADGVLYIEKGKPPYRIACVPHEDTKTIGAGDTFISALALSLASKLKGEVAAEIAAAAAAIVVEKDGTVGCTNNELKSYFNPIPKHVLSIADLERIVTDLKKNGKRIVFTNGCFDILHKGHVTLLNKARMLGDVLIVGVNNDASIRKLKGPERPINNLEDRLTVLAGLKSIDYLIDFEEDSPIDLIKAVHPHVFVKGGDYTETSIPEAPLVKKLGGEVKIVPYVEDHSTTQIINRIRDINEEIEIQMEDRNYAKASLVE